MDPTIAQYATLAANLGLAGFMAVMLLTWNKQAVDREKTEAQERKEQAKIESERCRECMSQQVKDKQAILDRVLERFEESTRFEQSVANNLSTLRRMDQIEQMLREGRKNGNTRRPPA